MQGQGVRSGDRSKCRCRFTAPVLQRSALPATSSSPATRHPPAFPGSPGCRQHPVLQSPPAAPQARAQLPAGRGGGEARQRSRDTCLHACQRPCCILRLYVCCTAILAAPMINSGSKAQSWHCATHAPVQLLVGHGADAQGERRHAVNLAQACRQGQGQGRQDVSGGCLGGSERGASTWQQRA